MLSGFTVQMRYMMCLLASYRKSIHMEIRVPGRSIVISPSRIIVKERSRRIVFRTLESLNDYLAREL